MSKRKRKLPKGIGERTYKTKEGKKRIFEYYFMFQGQRFSQSGFDTAEQATTARAQHLNRVRQGEGSEAGSSHTLEDVIDLKRVNNLEQGKGCASYNTLLRVLPEDLKSKPFLKVTKTNLQEWLNSIDGPSAKWLYKTLLAATFNHAKEIGLENVAMEKVKVQRPSDPEKYVPPTDDVEKVFSVMTPEDYDYFRALYILASRPGTVKTKEVGFNALKWQDVNFDLGHVTLYTSKSRGSRKRGYKLPIGDGELKAILERRKEAKRSDCPYVFWETNGRGKPLRFGRREYALELYCKEARVKTFTPGCLRNRRAVDIYTQSNNLSVVQAYLGHLKATTTDNYLRSLIGDFEYLNGTLKDFAI